MQQVAIFEAKNKLPFLLHLIESGESFEITRHGKPVAVLSSHNTFKKINSAKEQDPFEKAYLQFRNSISDENLTDREWEEYFSVTRISCAIRHNEDFQ